MHHGNGSSLFGRRYQSLWTPSSLPPNTNPATSPSRPHRGGPRPDYEKQLEEREAAAAAAAAAQQDLSGATGVSEVSESLSALEERLLEDYLERKVGAVWYYRVRCSLNYVLLGGGVLQIRRDLAASLC